MNYENSSDYAVELDRQDSLKQFQDSFYFPHNAKNQKNIYLCGNSLGLQTKSTRKWVSEILDAWAFRAVKGHFTGPHPWLAFHELLTEKLASVVGAHSMEVVAMNSLTVNLHLMMVSFYRPTVERNKILIEAKAFSSDVYAVSSQIRFHGFEPETSLIVAHPRQGEINIRTEDLLALIESEGDTISLILFPGVQYFTGQAFDMAKITEAGHKKGCIVGFDLAHAAGNLLLKLHDWNVDFAVWCSYKYLNAGPGAVAACFVHERYSLQFDLPRFTGWWGHDKSSRFQMPDQFCVLPGAEGWQISNPPILSMAPLLASLEQFDKAGMPALRAKSEKLTAYLDFLLRQQCDDKITIITPATSDDRGAQLSLILAGEIQQWKKVHEKLTQAGVVCDWREPNVMRVAPVPLYNRFIEVFDFVKLLQSIL